MPPEQPLTTPAGPAAAAAPSAGGATPPLAGPAAGLARAWRVHGLALGALLLFILLVYRGTAEAMVGIWMRSETFAHAFVVPPISLWLVWRLRATLLQAQPRAVPWLALPLAALALLWWLGDLVATNALTQLTMTAMLVAAVPAVLGWQAARVIMFPLGFLFFSVPVGEFLTPMLMEHTADVLIAALRLTGIPVYREGQQFIIPSGHWSVVEACSGIRYLMASLMAGTLFAYLNYRSHTRRWVFVGVAIAVPIVANWLRAYIIVMLGHLSDNRIATGVDHLLYGWLFFGVVIMLMFYLGARWSEPDEAPGQPPAGSRSPAAASWGFAPALLATTLAVCAVAVAWPLALGARQAASPEAASAALQLPAMLDGGWRERTLEITDWRPRFTEPTATARRDYEAAPGQVVGLQLAYYEHQTDQRKLVNSENVLVHTSDDRWNIVSGGVSAAQLPAGQVQARSATLAAPPSRLSGVRPRLRVWRLYWVDGQWVQADLHAKLLQAWQALRGQGDAGAVLVLYTPEESANVADARLNAFLAANAGRLDQLLRAMRTP